MKIEASDVMQGETVKEAINDLIWSAIPSNKRDTSAAWSIRMKIEASDVMECETVKEAIDELIWSAIPSNKRATDCPCASIDDAVAALLDAVIDKVDSIESSPYQYCDGDAIDAAIGATR